MNRMVLYYCLLVWSIVVGAQPDYRMIDSNSISVPDSLSEYEEIANYLTRELDSDEEKARAIYIWIAHNVHYDLAQLQSNKRYESPKAIIEEVLRDRKGVCQHYSELFHAMGQSVGLKTFLISGYTRELNGKVATYSHAWNGIKIGKGYYLIDVTWAAGYVMNGKYVHKFRDRYFLKSPEVFIRDHMPFDPIWQFVNNPLDNQSFSAGDFSRLDMYGSFAFEDSINLSQTVDQLAYLEKSNERIIRNGISNKLIQSQIDENNLQIVQRKFNIGVDTLNYGVKHYNLYISHKNRRFRHPKLEDEYVQDLILKAEMGVFAANDMFYGLFSSNKELNSLISDARDRMPGLISDVEREVAFVDRYLEKWKPLREFMF